MPDTYYSYSNSLHTIKHQDIRIYMCFIPLVIEEIPLLRLVHKEHGNIHNCTTLYFTMNNNIVVIILAVRTEAFLSSINQDLWNLN